jgi:hypothetical protein
MAALGYAPLMSEQPHPISETQIQELLRQLPQGDEDARAFAFLHLTAYANACQTVLQCQRTEGRTRVVAGEDPEVIRAETEAGINEARQRLHGKLVSLLRWAAAKRPNDE